MNGLKGKSVCLIEDDWLFALDTSRAFENAGACIVGPFPSEETAFSAFKSGQKMDCAVVDIRLMDGVRFGVAAHLQRQRIPFIFLTAVNRMLIPPQFARVRVFTKPVDFGLIILAVASLLPPRPRVS